MTMTSNTDFRELYFEHKHMEKILAEPSFTSLHYLLRRLKANASSVPCTLGGGAHGYVGMLLSPQAYASLSNIPFDEPLHPGRLVIPPGSTQYEIAHIKSTHENDLTIFQEYNLMQRALISQVCEAVDPQYTAALRNRITGQISANCREILLYLFRIYGKVTPSQLVSEEDAVKKLTYDTSIPIDGIFNSIEDLQELAELSGVPYTPSQIVNLGFIIMNSHRMLRSDVRNWIRKPAVEKRGLLSSFTSPRPTSSSGKRLLLRMRWASTAPAPLWTPLWIGYETRLSSTTPITIRQSSTNHPLLTSQSLLLLLQNKQAQPLSKARPSPPTSRSSQHRWRLCRPSLLQQQKTLPIVQEALGVTGNAEESTAGTATEETATATLDALVVPPQAVTATLMATALTLVQTAAPPVQII